MLQIYGWICRQSLRQDHSGLQRLFPRLHPPRARGCCGPSGALELPSPDDGLEMRTRNGYGAVTNLIILWLTYVTLT